MHISRFHLQNVGVFSDIQFDFDSRINVFVGPNNCGKTTALLAIADLAVDPFSFPKKHLRIKSRFSTRLNGPHQSATIAGRLPIQLGGTWKGKPARRLTKLQRQLGYTVFIPALRVGTDFRSKGPTDDKKKEKRFRMSEIKDLDQDQASFVNDAAIVQDLIALDYQAYRQNNPAIRKTIERIASVCSQITEGFPVSFAGVDEDDNGLYPVFKTPDGKVPINVLSQGTQGLLIWLAQFVIGYSRHYKFPESFHNKPGILIIDEIDAHLHPSWQRRILPELVKEFPALQVFCSTHSPLMIAGLGRGQVQLLLRDKQGNIVSSRNQTDIKGWSADEIYASFLGIENPTDIETDQEVERLEDLRTKKKPSKKERREITRLRTRVSSTLQKTPTLQKDKVDEIVKDLRKTALTIAAEAKPPRSPKK